MRSNYKISSSLGFQPEKDRATFHLDMQFFLLLTICSLLFTMSLNLFFSLKTLERVTYSLHEVLRWMEGVFVRTNLMTLDLIKLLLGANLSRGAAPVVCGWTFCCYFPFQWPPARKQLILWMCPVPTCSTLCVPLRHRDTVRLDVCVHFMESLQTVKMMSCGFMAALPK